MTSKPSKNTVISGVAIFICLPLLIGLLMYSKMTQVLHTYTENQVTQQAQVARQLALRILFDRLDELERVSGYLRDGRIAEEEMGAVVDRLLNNPSQISNGILRLDGTPVSGQALHSSEYPAIQNAFRGSRTVRYREGEGLLFTVPVYNGENVRYALYEFFDQNALFQGFSDICFNGQGRLMLADYAQEIIMPISANMTADDPYFQQETVKQSMIQLREKMITAITATVYCEADTKDFVFASEFSDSDLYLVGIIPHDAVAENIGYLSGMVMLVFCLLLALLAIGVVRIVSMDAKARESDELRKAKQIAEEASRSKSTFLANMSHELRTPINTITGMDEMILRGTREADTRERAMDIKSAAQILMGLINDVLDFSKIESGMLNIIPVEYNLPVLIRDLNLMSENRARAKSLEFRMEIQPELPIGLHGDDIRIQQVLMNLLTNAVKYTQKGTVWLKITGTPVGADRVILHCEVKDTGIGIRPEEMPRLFQAYGRADEVRNRNVEGSGLGLSIITNLLRLMNSELHVESVYNEGSRFYFDLEQEIVDPEPVGDIQARLEAMVKDYEYRVSCIAPRARILLVDDNSMNRKIFISLLKQTQIPVTAVSSGKKCLELVKKEHFDLIFMDHLMPEMDGVETLQHLRKQEQNLCKDTPIIALTANAFTGARETYMALGFDGFLSKPIITEKLEETIRSMLPKEYLEEVPVKGEDASKWKTLPAIEGVNWEYAQLHIQDTAILGSALEEFYGRIDAECRETERLERQTDAQEGLEAYRIQVHALKSTAAMTGMLSISELARLLETAARQEAREEIAALQPLLIRELLTMKERLRPFMEKEEEKRPLPDSCLLPAMLEMLRSAMDAMDLGETDRVMAQLLSYSYPEQLQERLERLGELVRELNFDGAAGLVRELLEELGPSGT